MNILIPTDFSDSARNAIQYAIALFGEEDHRFILMNAYEEPSSSTASMISLRDILHESSVEALRDEEKYIREELKLDKANLTLESIYGDAVSCIKSCLIDHKISLIVMGTTGATGLKEVMMGSVAAGVIQRVPCPVLVVPGAHEFNVMDKVLFATDPQNTKHQPLPPFFAEMLKDNDSQVTFLSVEKEHSPAAVANAYESELEEVEMDTHSIEADHVDEAIMSYAVATASSLIVTMPRKSTWFSRLLKHSVSKHLAHHLQIPMLALNPYA